MPQPASTWSWRGRAAVVGGALLATFPVWPGVQPGEPVADELLPPVEVALLVPIVLLFPLAWALLGGRRRPGLAVGAVLVLAVGVWAGGTVTLAGYGTPPSVDDWLRYHLLFSGILVAVAAAVTNRSAWLRPRVGAGLALWLAGAGALLAVPVLDGVPAPPRDALLPLPPGVVLVSEEAGRFTLTASDGAEQPALVRRVGDHLRDAKGWHMTWYDFTSAPDIDCRPAGLIVNPYRLCAWFLVEPGRSTVELRLGYSNPYDPIF
jgi:hypothetical protein